MFKYFSKIDNVEYFQIDYNNEVIKFKNANYFFNGEAVKDYKYIGLQSNGLICRKTADFYFIENMISGKITKLDSLKNYSTGSVFSENGTFYTINNNFDDKVIDFRRDFYYHNFKTNDEKLLIQQGIGYFAISYDNNTKSIFRSYNKLSSLSILSGEYEWELDLGGRKYIDSGEEKETKIKQIIGIWENQLLVSMTNGELVSIEISTGQIIFETHGLVSKIRTNESYKWWDFLLNPHLENGKLYELVGSQYYSFDLNSQNLEILWQDDREEGYFSVKHTTYTEDYIYFTGSFENRFQPHLIGAFNRKTLSIDWVEDVNLSIDPSLGYVASLNQAPQVSEDKLYVLDSGGTLHIFERAE